MSEETRNLIRGLFVIGLVIVAAAVGGWLYAKGMLFDSSTAAWVQGIGTILAVWAAGQIASRQGREAEQRDERSRIAELDREKRSQQARRRAALGLAHIARTRIQIIFTLISDPNQRHLLIEPTAFINALDQSEATLAAFPIWEVDDVEAIEAFSNIFVNISFARIAVQKLIPYANMADVPPEEILEITSTVKNSSDNALNNCTTIGSKLSQS